MIVVRRACVVAAADGIKRLELDEVHDVHTQTGYAPRIAGRLMSRVRSVNQIVTNGVSRGAHQQGDAVGAVPPLPQGALELQAATESVKRRGARPDGTDLV